MAALPQGFEEIKDVKGFLELNSDGAVLSSSGELENDEKVAGVITKMLQTAAKMPLSEDQTHGFKRLSLYFEGFILMATVANERIYVVKRPLKQESE